MRSKSFKFLSPPDAGALRLLEERLHAAVSEGIQTLKIDLRDSGPCPEGTRVQLEKVAAAFRDRMNHSVEVLWARAPATPTGKEKVDPPEPDKEGSAEIKLVEFGLGELDIASTDRLYQLALDTGARGAKSIFINFKGVHTLTAGAIMTLIKVQKALEKDKKEMLLLIPDDSQVYKVIQATALTEGFRIGFTN